MGTSCHLPQSQLTEPEFLWQSCHHHLESSSASSWTQSLLRATSFTNPSLQLSTCFHAVFATTHSGGWQNLQLRKPRLGQAALVNLIPHSLTGYACSSQHFAYPIKGSLHEPKSLHVPLCCCCLLTYSLTHSVSGLKLPHGPRFGDVTRTKSCQQDREIYVYTSEASSPIQNENHLVCTNNARSHLVLISSYKKCFQKTILPP